VLVSGGAAFGLWYQHQQAAAEAAQRERDQERALQRAKAQQGVELALQEAHTHGEQARQPTTRPDAWQTTLAAAQFAVTRAEKLLEQDPELAQGELVKRVRQVKVELGADERDRLLLAAFDKVREDQSLLYPSRRGFNLAATYPLLRQALAEYGLAPGALPAGQAAALLRQRPKAAALKYATAHYNLGQALYAQGEVMGAIACYKKALDLDPKDAKAHVGLGNALGAQGDVKRAISCYTKALALDPGYALAHNNLGVVLQAQGDVKGAIACYTQALDLDPKFALAHCNLGHALHAQGDVAGAIACYTQALKLDPRYAQAHYALGLALYAKKDQAGAIACYKQALALDPKYAEAHCNLGHALRDQGHFAPALQALQRGHQLGSPRPSWRYPSARWVDDCQRLLDLDARLSAILKGEDQPKDTAEQLALAVLCQRYKKRYAAAARFYADAFAAGAAQSSQRAYRRIASK
jgi:tetratricopeptide (TPR) repeat protein